MTQTRGTPFFAAIPWRLAWVAGVILVAGLFVAKPATPSPAAWADEGALPPDLDLVPRSALGFSTIRIADLFQSEHLKGLLPELLKLKDSPVQELEKLLGMPLTNLERGTVVLLTPDPENGLAFILSTVKPFAQAHVLQSLAPGASEEKHGGKTYFVQPDRRLAIHFGSDRILVISSDQGMPRFLDQMARKNLQGPLGEALSLAAEKHHVVSALDPEPLANLVGNELPLPIRPFAVLLKARLASAVVDVNKDLQTVVRLRFAKEDDAKEADKAMAAGLFLGRQLLGEGVREMAKNPQGIENVVKLLRQVLTTLQDVAPQREGSVVRVSATLPLDGVTLAAAQLEGITRIRFAAERMKSVNNLKQIALAMHNYHDTYGRFPPAVVYSKDGRPLYSWRVLLLPFLEQANLFQQFKKDEPWDSPHNKKLLAMMPPVYAPVRGQTTEPYSTYYQVFVGQGSVFEGRDGRRFTDITDGMSNTLLVVEAGQPVPWSKPEDIAFVPDQAIPPLGGLFADGFNAAFCDGSVRFLKRSIDPKVLRLLIIRNDGQPINSKDLE